MSNVDNIRSDGGFFTGLRASAADMASNSLRRDSAGRSCSTVGQGAEPLKPSPRLT